MKTTTKVQCSCEHEQQDKLYGKNVRLANATAKRDKDTTDVRCTVCGKVHRVNSARMQ